MKKKYFGTDGIRGTVNYGNINGEKFFKFGLAEKQNKLQL
jgi:phosphoglucosamine mutase